MRYLRIFDRVRVAKAAAFVAVPHLPYLNPSQFSQYLPRLFINSAATFQVAGVVIGDSFSRLITITRSEIKVPDFPRRQFRVIEDLRRQFQRLGVV